jgi:Ca-activated chloride channel family protein
MAELGDFYSGETRKLLIEFSVPAMAALGLATIAEMTLGHVELPALQQHTVTLPVSVNVVPADVAANRVPAPEVHREKLLLSAQRAKQDSEEALARGDYSGARSSLDLASASLASMPDALRDDEVASEIAWLAETRDGLEGWDRQYSSKRLRSERMRKSRGHKNRTQGGEVG